MVFEAAAFRHIEPAPIAHVRASAEREAREAARSGSTKSTDELLTTSSRWRRSSRQQRRANAELVKDNKTLRDNAAAYAANSNWQGQLSTAGDTVPEASAETAAPTSIAEAVQLAQARAKNVRFLPSAHASAADSPYRQPERVLQALSALEEVASIWAETVGSGKAGGSVRQLFKARGFEYADDVSQTSKGKWERSTSPTTRANRSTYRRTSPWAPSEADTCLSIHWAWLRDERPRWSRTLGDTRRTRRHRHPRVRAWQKLQ